MRSVTAIGVLFMIMSSFLVWIEGPIRGGVSGISFGWIALLIGSMAGVAWFCRSSRLLAVWGVTGLGLCSFSILHLAFMDPAFWSLVEENTQYAQIMRFSRLYLPANFGIEPTFQANLLTETVMDRLATASYFMGWGWWIYIAGSFLVLVGCFSIKAWQTIRWTAIAAIVIFAGQGIILFNGFAAQYQQEKGDRNMAHGRYGEAIQRYEAAQRFDPQLRRNERIHLRFGEAYYGLGIPSHPNGRFYLGNRYSQQRNLEAAISEYLLAVQEASAPLKEVIRKRLAWTYVNMGFAQYRQGNIGRAAGQWERTLAVDPAQLQAVYFLARAYFDQGRYEQSIAVSRSLLAQSQNRLLNANVQANIGDSYWRLNALNKAREAYETSIRLDSYKNYRIVKSLGGT